MSNLSYISAMDQPIAPVQTTATPSFQQEPHVPELLRVAARRGVSGLRDPRALLRHEPASSGAAEWASSFLA